MESMWRRHPRGKVNGEMAVTRTKEDVEGSN